MYPRKHRQDKFPIIVIFPCTLRLLCCVFHTELSQPQGHTAVDLVQDQNNHQVDDDGGGRHRHADVGLGLRVGAHGHQSRHGDAVHDDAKDGGESQAELDEGVRESELVHDVWSRCWWNSYRKEHRHQP